MRKLILLINLSLDGFTAGPNGELDWVVFDDGLWQDVIALQDSADTALFGRVNYQDFESYWPPVATNACSTDFERAHSRWLNNSLKIVFSTTLKKVEWKNSRILRANFADELTALRQQPGKNLLLLGGAGIATTLIQLGLIDEYRINLNPVILGRGKPLFKDIKYRRDLKLLNSKAYPSGVVGLHYERPK